MSKLKSLELRIRVLTVLWATLAGAFLVSVVARF